MTVKEAAERRDVLAKLRDPFAPGQIGKLPKPYNKDAAKGNCRECGGYHGLPALHLDFVGHAALTDRFLDVDPEWSWEPVGYEANGLPAFDKHGGLWIKLTICGVTRLGYGDAMGKTGPNAVKETIGDALRNAGMRFGAALDLWHKGDLHDASQREQPSDEPAPPADPEPYRTKLNAASNQAELARVGAELATAGLAEADLVQLRQEYRARLSELTPAALPDPDSAGYDPMGLDGGDK